MVIAKEVLELKGAIFSEYQKGEYIFSEGDHASSYYQVIEGSVKMSSYSTEGKEFIQGVFKAGDCFGEPALFGGFSFPNNAIAIETCTVAKLKKDLFFELLKEQFELQMKFTEMLSKKLRYKAILLKEISSYCPDHIILTLLKYLKDEKAELVNTDFLVPFTRQQIADMTGLRVETVIRTVRKLQEEGKLQIKNHKIYLPV